MSLGRTIADLELRNAAAMRSAQASYETPTDVFEDEDALTEDMELEQARDEILSSGAWVADTLAKLTDSDAGWQSFDVFADDGESRLPAELTAAQLLAVVLLGFDRDAIAARYELRDRLASVLRADIRERADDLLREQARRMEQQLNEEFAAREWSE